MVVSSFLHSSCFYPRKMEWHLTKPQDGVLLGCLSSTATFSSSTDKHITGLLPGSLKKEYPIGETPITASIFLNCFSVVHGEFPSKDFRPLGWVHSSVKGCWSVLTGFSLKKFESQQMKIGLYHAIRAIQHGIPPSRFHFLTFLSFSF